VMQLSLEKLRALNVPVIAHLKRGEFIWVTQIDETKVVFCDSSGKEKNENPEQFEKEWSGVALAIQSVDKAGDPNYKEERKKELKEKLFKYLIYGAIAVLLTVLSCFAWTYDVRLPLLPKILLLFINAAGCYISFLLIRQEKRQSDALANRFCKVGKYIDCNKVTASKYSNFFGLLSWAELGAAYFISMLLWVTIAPISAGWLPPLWWVSVAVLPFTLWSLVTQAFVIRKWCLFCCTIVFLLWANAAILLVFNFQPETISIPNAAIMALLFIVSLVAVMKTGNTIGSKTRLYAQQRETAKIKYDYRTIQSQLSETIQPIDKLGFSFGNSEASQEISLYVSTACSHCNHAIQELRRLIEIYPNFSCQLIFSVSSDDYDDDSNVIIRHFFSLYKTLDNYSFLEMLEAWYTTMNKNLNALQKRYHCLFDQGFKEEINDLYQFNKQAEIGYTPAMLLNGRLLSQSYSYKDLLSIVRALNAEE